MKNNQGLNKKYACRGFIVGNFGYERHKFKLADNWDESCLKEIVMLYNIFIYFKIID